MKIVFIGQKGIPAKYGGVEKHVEEVAKRLAARGQDVLVYTRPNFTDKSLNDYEGVKLVSLPTFPTKNLDAITHTLLACLDVWRRKVDVIHFHSIGPSSLIWLVKILKPRTPVVATFHTQCYFHQKWSWLARLYLHLGEQAICHLPDKTITVSKTLTKFAKDKHGCESAYIPNGVAKPADYPVDKIRQFGLAGGDYIVAVSRLVRHKGLQHLIKAYKNIKTGKKLVIVGGGAYTDDYVQELKEQADGNPNIIFTGNQSGRTLIELFAHASVFVQPSESEGLSIALLEAMSFGLPIVASDIPENKELVEDVGLLFNSKDPKDLAAKLKYCLKQPELMRSLGRLARKRAAKNYNWDNIVDNIFEVYNEAKPLKNKNFKLAKVKS